MNRAMQTLKTAVFFATVCSAMTVPSEAAQTVYSHGSPSNYEQLMLELVNRARARPEAEALRYKVALNGGLPAGTISTSRKQPLAFNRHLLAAARDHSEWMLKTGNFSHVGANGSLPSDRAAARGFPFGAAENIESGSSTSVMNLTSGTKAAHAGLFKSPVHRKNLMDPSYSVVGAGVLFARSGGWSERRTTQNFGQGVTAQSGPFILGVAFNDKNGNKAYDPGEGLGGIKVRPSAGSYYAVTSSSGGFAIPIRPVTTRSGIVQVNLPFAVNTPEAGDKAQIYDRSFRAQQIKDAQVMEIVLRWSGERAGMPVTNVVKIKRPERINYHLTGTDGFFFDRSMVTTSSVKADLVFTAGIPHAIVR